MAWFSTLREASDLEEDNELQGKEGLNLMNRSYPERQVVSHFNRY